MRCCVEAGVSSYILALVKRRGGYLIALAAPERRIIEDELVYEIRVWNG